MSLQAPDALVDHLLPTLFSKTFFLVSVQLLATWLTTYVVFRFFLDIDPQLAATSGSDQNIATNVKPKWHWVFTKASFNAILIFWFATFLVLLWWGVNQPLPLAFSLFTLWSFITGVMLEYVLITFDHGFGQRMIALTATVIFACAVVGIYSKIDFGFLQIPLFIALTSLVGFNIFRLFGAMKSVRQGLVSGFGIVLFTLYLLFDFNSLEKRQAAGDNGWPEAMSMSIKIYLDAINLLLNLLSRHHH
jgi:FtsH-binding integral membrane protein